MTIRDNRLCARYTSIDSIVMQLMGGAWLFDFLKERFAILCEKYSIRLCWNVLFSYYICSGFSFDINTLESISLIL